MPPATSARRQTSPSCSCFALIFTTHTTTIKFHIFENHIATMKFLSLALFAASSAAVSGIELTPANYDAETSGKSVFIKFFAPWYVDVDIAVEEKRGFVSVVVVAAGLPAAANGCLPVLD